MKKIIIVAHDDNLVIGKDNKIPWNIKEEMKHFKETTLNNVVIMGKNTYLSLNKKPLRDRENAVITRSDVESGFTKFSSLEEAYKYYEEQGKEKVFIIGGKMLYEEALKTADEAIITQIYDSYEGDTYFPVNISEDWDNWDLIKIQLQYKKDPEDIWTDIINHRTDNILFEIGYYKRKNNGK